MSGQQTTGAGNFTEASIEVSINGGAFTDICGEATSIAISGGDRDVAEFFTACGDGPIVLLGKKHKLQVAVRAAYTEGAADSYVIFEQAYQVKGTIAQLRWTPRGDHVGNFRYTTNATYSFVSSPVYPQGEVAAADATEFTANIETTDITRDAVT